MIAALSRRRELTLVIVLALALSAMLAGIRAVRIEQMRGDTAIFLQATKSIPKTGLPMSQVFANTQGFIDKGYFGMTPAEVERDALTPPPPSVSRNMLGFHGYLILYPLALLALIIPAQAVLFGAYALCFVGLIALSYLVLRHRGAGVVAAAAFCVLLLASPAWSWSALWGQFYPDRLFVFFGFAFALTMARKNSALWMQIVLAAICLAINERSALTAGLFTLLFAALHWREGFRAHMLRIVIGAVLVLYGYTMIHAGVSDTAYSTFMPGSLSQAIGEWSNPQFAGSALVYIIACLPLLICAFFDWRAGVIAVIFMLPNLFGYIGGAEKIGWSTHYHSYDFPMLVWAALNGYTVALRRFSASRGMIPALAVLIASFALTLFDPTSYAPIRFGGDQLANSFFVAFPQYARADLSSEGMRHRALADQLAQAVPPGTVVTTVEAGMPFLYDNRAIRIYPMGVDSADYAVVNDEGIVDGQRLFGGVVNAHGAQAQRELDEWVMQRMRRDGYDFAHPVVIQGLDLAVVKRDPARRVGSTASRRRK